MEIAKNMTGETDENDAIREFKKIIDNPKENFNTEPFPANESNENAYRNCSDKQSAEKNCPKRWAAMAGWSSYCRSTMAMLAPKLIPLFYHTGRKITVPNCPMKMFINFNPSSSAQSSRPSDASCRKATRYNLPFFLDNFGPKYSEMTVTAHEAWPGHHTQLQGWSVYLLSFFLLE